MRGLLTIYLLVIRPRVCDTNNKMRLFLALVALCVSAAVVVGYPQSQNVDPAYLRQYYAHLAQANREEGTPIYESGNQEQVHKGGNI